MSGIRLPSGPEQPYVMGWQDRAACRGVDPELFFPIGDEEHTGPEARASCASCPVQAECLQFAIVTRSVGFWGGMTTDQRRNWQRRGQRSRRPTRSPRENVA